MIERIEIERFKGIKNVKIDNLGKINIFVGANNSKKTTILEAISLFNISDVENLRRILSGRKYIGYEEVLNSFFYNLDVSENPVIKLSKKESEEKLEIFCEKKVTEISFSEKEIFNKANSSENQKIIYKFLLNNKPNIEIKVENNSIGFSSFANLKESNIVYVPTNREISKLADNIRKLQNYKKIDELTEILKCYDKNLQKIYVDGYNIYVDLNNVDKSLSIGTMGEGFISSLIIISNLLVAGGNDREITILIDEVENGLYRTALKKLIRTILKLIKEYNIQLFITTHSEEFLKELYKLKLDNTVSLYRMENEKSNIKAIYYSEEEAKELLAEGWEIR
ncbi:AAA family ATPase [Fusobacterium perfoetens]|uniref:AAA family ATPase n=1 Tax=Fusobacterium perfoetens TaxID=852 RepID=UPI001F3D4005|nr:AAA family ATPase [Fusobacterium perfoetens]MCF2612275.1 AAA family ATPase [Fusobacterium perfoetens]